MDGKQLRKERLSRNIEQTELAKAIGVKSYTVSRWERGENKILKKHLDNIEKFFASEAVASIKRECKQCGVDISGMSPRAMYCSKECNNRTNDRKNHGTWEDYVEMKREFGMKQREETRIRKEVERKALMISKECAECGDRFETMNKNVLTCSSNCSKRRSNRLSWQTGKKRINDTNIVDRDISLKVLYKRDEGICYICGNKCDYNDYKKDGSNFTSGPTYPSVDHLIPLSRGGKHAWYNVRLAHHRCNSLKSDLMIDDVKRYIPDNAYVLARKVSPNKKEVKQYSKSMELIAVYESTAEASRQTGVKAKGIQSCARKEAKTYRGYIWEY